MAQLDVQERYLNLAPIIVTSPSQRCGTTLVQRLISASDNAFLYGEDVGQDVRTLTVHLFEVMQLLDAIGEASDEDFRRALAGTLSDWRPALRGSSTFQVDWNSSPRGAAMR
jgi:hypothetical protein